MKAAFLFSGQGAQYPGMMKDLYDNIPASRDVFHIADSVLGRKISELCFAGSQEELNLTHNTQPCMLAADLAAYAAISAAGVKPDAVAGFSLGEYAALAAAGVLSVEDAFRIVQIRADAMQEAVPVGAGAMAAVKSSDLSFINRLCDAAEGYVIPANLNCPGQVVISGESKAVDNFIALAKAEKLRALKLPVSAPFHCKLMKPAAAALEAVFAQTQFSEPVCDIYMNVDGLPERDAGGIQRKLLLQAYSQVLWEQTLLSMSAAGIDTFVELGAGKTLTSFVKKTLPTAAALHVDNMESLGEAGVLPLGM